MRTTIWSIAASAVLAMSVAVGDEVQERLDAAIAEYESVLAQLESDVQDQLGDLFERYANDGDLEKAQAVATLRETFATEGLLPDIPLLRTIREKARVRFSKANLDLRTAYKKAIADYTRARDLRAAEEARKTLQEFEKENGPDRIQFPRAERKKAAQRQQQQAVQVQASGSIPGPPPGSTAAGASSPRSTQPGRTSPSTAKAQVKKPEPSEELLAVINRGPERDVLSDRLASQTDKSLSAQALVRRVSREHPPSKMHYGDCYYLCSILCDVQASIGTAIVPKTSRASVAGIQWGFLISGKPVEQITDTEKIRFENRVLNQFLVLWLIGASDTEEFIRRADFLSRTSQLPEVSQAFKEDDLKVWLAALGCGTLDEVAEVIGQLKQAQVDLKAVIDFADREGL